VELRNFLMRHPRPIAIRVERQDGGEPRTVQVDPRVPWVQLAGYIAELGPTFVECLDAEGKVLRGADFDDLDHGGPGETERPPASTPVAAQLKVPADPQSAQLVLFAQLLADAYRHTTDVAFDRMIDLFEAVNRRGENTEKSLDQANKLLARIAQDRAELAAMSADGSAPGELTMSDMVQAFMGGQQQAAPAVAQPVRRPPGPGPAQARPHPPNPHANGMNGKGHS
jgi:hypothetical protein